MEATVEVKMEAERRFSVRNATAWAASSDGRLVRLEVLVTLSCALLTTLVFFGSGRRASHSGVFRFVVWSALMLSYPAVSYTIGLMQSGAFHDDLVAVWACLLLGCADGISACSVDDSDQQARTMLNQAAQTVYVFFLLLSYADSLQLQLKVLLFLLWLLNLAKLALRLRSMIMSIGLGRDRVISVENRIITKYMRDKHKAGEVAYPYLVVGEASLQDERGEYRPGGVAAAGDDHLVTVDDVWQCKGRLLSSDDQGAHKLKDLCLSFALFKLLRRRLSGSPLYQFTSADDKAYEHHRFPDTGGGGCAADEQERTYRVIEVELGFLFDFFYARYPSPDQTLLPETAAFAAAVALSLSTLFSSPLLHQHHHRSSSNLATTTSSFDIWLTRSVVVLFLLLESFQYLTLLLSDWHKVKTLCRYVRSQPWQKNHPMLECFLKLVFPVTLTRRYWSNSVAQYSLLRSCFDFAPGRRRSSCTSRLPLPEWVRTSLKRRSMVAHRDLTTAAKRAIYLRLQAPATAPLASRLAHGDVALQDHRVGWMRLPHGVVRSMLVWHIATTICDYRLLHGGGGGGAAAAGESREVATSLSEYCAYLLFYAPELVMETYRDTQIFLEILQRTVRRRLGGCVSKEDMLRKLRELQAEEDDDDQYEGILADGRRLGDLIAETFPDDAARWKMLADVWAEKLLSIAPSSNVDAHIKKLATGGELITHLWALLTHKGIVAQPEMQERAPGWKNRYELV